MIYIYFTLYILLQPIGQMLQKMGLNQVGIIDFAKPMTLIKALSNPLVIAGAGLMVCGLVLWLMLLSKFNLSYIQPIGAVIYIVIAILSYFILHEAMTVTKVIGIVIIAIGVFLINYSNGQ